jgi:hypothetical protein
VPANNFLRRARFAAALVGLLAMSACEQHTLTRPAEGNTAYRWTLIWVAGAVLTSVVASTIVTRFRKHPGWRRAVGAGFWIGTATVLLLLMGSQFAIEHRSNELQDRFGGCRDVPVAERAPSLVPITCQEGGLDFETDFSTGLILTVLFAAAYISPVAIPVAIGVVALRSRRQYLWIPGAFAIGAAVFIAGWLGEAQGAARVGGALFVLGAIASATCLMTEWYTRGGPSRISTRNLPS